MELLGTGVPTNHVINADIQNGIMQITICCMLANAVLLSYNQ